ncbi:hypothetical protein CIPAW_14G075900 [Carya illinoinensis]|uniref:Uncharacterized protein n=1 Tax=Carya illinoinensis TaxID=32201 RepID=A0A8T1NC89_CARIL|nr:hypothetical protein CIPAW_14G075900 [Carya illinoinensis]
MAATFPNTDKKKNSSFPPRRGQIKAQIFGSIAKKVVSTASKVGAALEKIRGEDRSGGNSASSTPPSSAYNSDLNSDSS